MFLVGTVAEVSVREKGSGSSCITLDKEVVIPETYFMLSGGKTGLTEYACGNVDKKSA
jgi:hypothetical protein